MNAQKLSNVASKQLVCLGHTNKLHESTHWVSGMQEAVAVTSESTTTNRCGAKPNFVQYLCSNVSKAYSEKRSDIIPLCGHGKCANSMTPTLLAGKQ